MISSALAAAARPVLARLAPETAHRAAIEGLKFTPIGRASSVDPRLAVEVFGLKFPHPLGLAAGFDKDAEVPRQLLGLGFAFVEVGTLTPRPQAGNPKPRLFRLPEDRALVNRMGFNNGGYAAALPRIEKPMGGLFGVNFGPNKDAQDRIAD